MTSGSSAPKRSLRDSLVGGFDVQLPHPLETIICDAYGLSPRQLQRLAVFLLAHAFVDVGLTKVVTHDKLLDMPEAAAPPDSLAKVWRQVAKQRFANRLKTATRRRLLSEEALSATKQLNDARDSLAHLSGRQQLPTYEGHPLVEEAGLNAALDGAARLIGEAFTGKGRPRRAR